MEKQVVQPTRIAWIPSGKSHYGINLPDLLSPLAGKYHQQQLFPLPERLRMN
jgi:hypothetical protein